MRTSHPAPNFITDLPTTHSIAYGVIAGVGSYLLLNVLPFLIRKATGDRIVPPLYDLSEQWRVPPGGFAPLWMRNVYRGNWRRFWEDDNAAGSKAVHPQMQMYAANGGMGGGAMGGVGGGKNGNGAMSTSKVHVVDAYSSPGAGDIALGGMNGRKMGGGNGNGTGVIVGNTPALPRFQHHSLSMEEYHTYDDSSPTDAKFGGIDRVAMTPSPEGGAAYPPRKFA